MILITVSYSQQGFEELTVSGHAGSGPYGHDLVCAAVSAISIGGLNALKEDAYETEIKEGYLHLKKVGKISHDDEVVIETIITQLESLAQSYPKNARLERKQIS